MCAWKNDTFTCSISQATTRSGSSPVYFEYEKDYSEINAIHQVWLSADVQLCFWHAKRAIQT